MRLSFPDVPAYLEDSLVAFPYEEEDGLTGEFESGFGPSQKIDEVGFLPHLTFFLEPEDLVEGAVSELAKFVGWRSVVEGREEGRLAALIRNEESPDEANLVELNIGRYVEGSFEAFRLIQEGALQGRKGIHKEARVSFDHRVNSFLLETERLME